MRRLPLMLLAAAGLSALWAAGPRAPAQDPSAPPTAAPPSSRFATVGVASCASTACHHANGPAGSWRSEYTTWATLDPHAHAYDVLFEPRSKQIVERLGQPAAHKNALCLNCHVGPDALTAPHRPQFSLQDGVGCEACHGAAEKWVSLHYLEEWKAKTPEEKEALGLRDTKNLVVRSGLCSTCHVGNGDNDVNHDLIAAGHPRLAFEFSAYQANLPKHWKEKGENARPDFQMRSWNVGRTTSAQTAMNLLAHRAEKAKPWPEFAEYDCFACHHDLQGKSWRQARGYDGRQPGSLSWGNWYLGLDVEFLAPDVDLVFWQLRQMMNRPGTSAAEVAKQAHAAAGTLGLSRKRQRYTEKDACGNLALWWKLEQQEPPDSWDRAVIRYLALADAYHTLSDMGINPKRCDPALPDLCVWLKKRKKVLEFPKGFDSPSTYVPKRGAP
jgi:hypothetical protein